MSHSPSLSDLLAVAMDAAYAGGRRTLGYFNTNVEVETKSDNTPVTRADREAEAEIRRIIARHYPSHAVLGEETGGTPGDAGYRWIIDPIDGTKTFIHGVPFYGVLIAVEVAGQPAVGVVYLPALDEMVAAASGLGCGWNGRPARVSTVDRLEDATLLTTNVTRSQARSDAYDRLVAKTKLHRTWGDCYGYVLVATGRAEIMLDAAMNPWDCAPLLPILTEAGGHFSAWSGEVTIYGPDAVGTNAALHAEVLSILKTEKRR
ncbi:MAG TPA: histidinol-phosphatase [Tepidisphaeraceae bacterium]|nr:histidinol-phosphatase [Tepidisphaeraceae bacterium]